MIVLGESKIKQGQKYVVKLYDNEVWLSMVFVSESDICLEEMIMPEHIEDFIELSDDSKSLLKKKGLL
jgi:hypothetical protein